MDLNVKLQTVCCLTAVGQKSGHLKDYEMEKTRKSYG